MDDIEEPKANKAHYHVWMMAKTKRAMFKLAKGFESQPAASQWAKRNRPGEQRTVRQCFRIQCAPGFD